MRWIYISPHFDDAVLSCGGLIAEQSRQGLPVEIWTICAGPPPPGPLSDFANLLHAAWGTGDGAQTVELRKQEDQQAAGTVGAEAVHFDIPDCIYRKSAAGEPFYPQGVFAPPHPGEADLPERIATALGSELLADDLLVAPLARGGHVDHRLARQAVERLANRRYYYADIPYLINDPATLAPASAGLQAGLFPVPEAGLELWLAGIAAYRSQLDSLLKTGGKLEDAVRGYWQATGGLRLWQAPAAETA